MPQENGQDALGVGVANSKGSKDDQLEEEVEALAKEVDSSLKISSNQTARVRDQLQGEGPAVEGK